MKDYKKQHIIKHALEMYIERPEVTKKDLKQEISVLQEVKEEIAAMKEEYGIEFKEKEHSPWFNKGKY